MLHVSTLRAPPAAGHPDTPYDASNYPQSELPAYQQTPAQSETDLSDKPPWVKTVGRPAERVWDEPREAHVCASSRALKSVDDAVDQRFSRSSSRRARPPTRSPSSHPTTGISGGNTGWSDKSKPYLDSVQQVPLLMRWPANPKVQRNSNRPRASSRTSTWHPTALDAAGRDPGPRANRWTACRCSTGRSNVDRILTEYWGDLNSAPDEETGVASFEGQPNAAALLKWKVPTAGGLALEGSHAGLLVGSTVQVAPVLGQDAITLLRPVEQRHAVHRFARSGVTPAASSAVGATSMFATRRGSVAFRRTFGFAGHLINSGTRTESRYGLLLSLSPCSPQRYPLSDAKKASVSAASPVCSSFVRTRRRRRPPI